MDFAKKTTGKNNYKDLRDQDLVKLFRRKADEMAFNELMNRHQTKIYSYIYSMINNQKWLKIFSKLHSRKLLVKWMILIMSKENGLLG